MSHELHIENMTVEGSNNVVKQIRCILNVTVDSASDQSIFTINLDDPDSDANNFIEFESLTQNIVNGWVISNLGQDEYDARVYGLESKIAEGRVLPKTVNAPWLEQVDSA